MDITHDKATAPGEAVTVVLDGQESVRQPACFRLCPLGLQFYSPKALPEFEVVEFTLNIPARGGSKEEVVNCSGVVVHCRQEKDSALFRVWVKFVDLPESKRKRLQCVAETSDFLCPFCENF